MTRVPRYLSGVNTRLVETWHRRLPHWEIEEGTYFVTLHCADALPQALLDEVRYERDRDQAKRALFRHLEKYLDAGSGECLLHDTGIAAEILNALTFFRGSRLRFLAGCVMPNHIHFLIQTAPGESLRRIVASLKQFTANEVNARRNRSGQLWMREYFDHLIVDQHQVDRVIAYIERNPMKAGLSPEGRVLVLDREHHARWK